MKYLPKLLCLALLITFASCSASGSTVPVVRDYTNGNPTRNVQPQSVIGRCPPYEPNCVGGGGGGGGHPVYGTQGDCDTGYLYFSDGCEDDSLTFAESYATWTGNYVAQVSFDYTINIDVTHFWNKHLACYLTGGTTPWISAVLASFDEVWQTGGAPAPNAHVDIPMSYQNYTTVYRVYNVTSGGMTLEYYDVTTAYIPGKPNCPGY